MNLTPHANASHWSASLIGTPWSVEKTCWWLVQHVQRTHFGRELPNLAVGAPAPGQWGVLRELVQRSGWQRAAAPWLEGDVLLTTGPEGLHIGVVVNHGGRAGVLHSVGGLDDSGRAHGGVVLGKIEDLGLLGFGRIEGWRHA